MSNTSFCYKRATKIAILSTACTALTVATGCKLFRYLLLHAKMCLPSTTAIRITANRSSKEQLKGGCV